MEKLKMHSPNHTAENVEKLATLFPNCVCEVRDDTTGQLGRAIDFDQLRQELSGSIVDGPSERYHLNWPGKREATIIANAPIAKTLRPCREESVAFDTTGNIFIEGDNLDALKLLQETYLGRVKAIYIDPPYNTGNEFLYDDDFAESANEYLVRSGQKDDVGSRLTVNTEANGRFHSDWLTMIYSRLRVSRNLLRDDGLIFLSIDDNEQSNLRKICDEIFGEDNFIGVFVVKSTPNARNYGHIGKMHEYCLMYAKDRNEAVTFEEKVEDKQFKYSDSVGGFNIHPLYNSDESFHQHNRPNLFYPFYLSPDRTAGGDFYSISLSRQSNEDVEVYPPLSTKNGVQFVWRWGKEKAAANLNQEIVGYRTGDEYRIVRKMRHTERIVRSMFLEPEFSGRRGTAEVEALLGGKYFSFPKPISLIAKLLEISTRDNDIVLDFFAGSCTTAEAVIELNKRDGGNRKFIMVQIAEPCENSSTAFQAGFKNISDIGKERIRRFGAKVIESRSADEDDVNLDTGFRVLKIDTSNMKDVFYRPDELNQGQLDLYADNIKEDRTPEDLLFQVLVDWGVDLTLSIEKQTIANKSVFLVDGNALACCFDDDIGEDLVKELAQRKPLRAVFRDSSYTSDSTKINVEQVFKLLSPETEIRSL